MAAGAESPAASTRCRTTPPRTAAAGRRRWSWRWGANGRRVTTGCPCEGRLRTAAPCTARWPSWCVRPSRGGRPASCCSGPPTPTTPTTATAAPRCTTGRTDRRRGCRSNGRSRGSSRSGTTAFAIRGELEITTDGRTLTDEMAAALDRAGRRHRPSHLSAACPRRADCWNLQQAEVTLGLHRQPRPDRRLRLVQLLGELLAQLGADRSWLGRNGPATGSTTRSHGDLEFHPEILDELSPGAVGRPRRVLVEADARPPGGLHRPWRQRRLPVRQLRLVAGALGGGGPRPGLLQGPHPRPALRERRARHADHDVVPSADRKAGERAHRRELRLRRLPPLLRHDGRGARFLYGTPARALGLRRHRPAAWAELRRARSHRRLRVRRLPGRVARRAAGSHPSGRDARHVPHPGHGACRAGPGGRLAGAGQPRHPGRRRRHAPAAGAGRDGDLHPWRHGGDGRLHGVEQRPARRRSQQWTASRATSSTAWADRPNHFGVSSDLVRPIRIELRNGTLLPRPPHRSPAEPVGVPVGTAEDRQVNLAAHAVSPIGPLRPPEHAADAGAHAGAVDAGGARAGAGWRRPRRSRDHRRGAARAGRARRGPPPDRGRGHTLRAVRIERQKAEARAREPAGRPRVALCASSPDVAGDPGVRPAAGAEPRTGAEALRRGRSIGARSPAMSTTT